MAGYCVVVQPFEMTDFREAYADMLDARYLRNMAAIDEIVEAGMDTSEIRAAVDAIGELDGDDRLFTEIELYTEFIEYVARDAPEKWARLAKEVLRSKGE
jgi:hypothetical protein